MIFLNVALLGGVLAVGVPLAIHLLSRSRFRRVDWGAMFLLEQVLQHNRRRARLEQWLMLLVRCAIPVLLALAMAQPVLNGWQTLVGDAKGTSLILLDASYSMQTPGMAPGMTPGMTLGTGSGTRYDHARQQVRQLLEALPSGSEVSVVRVGDTDLPLGDAPTTRADQLARRLDATQASLGTVEAGRALRRGVEALGEAQTTKRDLILVSDFQRINWAGAGSGGERRRLAGLLEGQADRPNITLIPVGGEAGRNIAVRSVTLSADTVGVGQRVRVKATVANTGTVDVPDAPVRLVVNGAEVQAQHVAVRSGQAAEVLFFYRFEQGGGQLLEVATGGDILPADDVYRVAVEVVQGLPVLLVNGDTGRRFPENETDFLELALRPFAADTGTPLADLVRTRTVRPEQLDRQALAGQRVVVLADVERLSDPQVQALRLFVQAGGGLVVFPGDVSDPAWMDDRLADLLPAAFAGLSGVGLDFEAPATLLDPRQDHPALALWSGPSRASLAGGEVRVWYDLAPRPEGQTIARLSTGQPFLTERRVGAGVVLLAATACDAGWSNLPARAFYLPLMQRLVAYAATRSSPPRTVRQGRPMLAHLDASAGVQTAQWVLPDGTHVRRPVEEQDGRWVCGLEDTAQPGYYRLLRPGSEPMLFASNPPRGESDLDPLTGDELQALADEIGAQLVADADAYAALDHSRRHGTPVWHWAWGGLLVLLFGELCLQQWVGKGGGR